MDCSVEGCTRPHEARGLCKVHYNKAVRNHELRKYPTRGRPRQYTEEERKQRKREQERAKYLKKVANRPRRINKTNNPAYAMWRNSITRAKEKGIPYNLELVDIVIPEACPCLGIPLEKGDGVYTDNSPTLDRLIPELGYVKGNVWVISMRANRMKNDASIEEMEKIIKAVKNKLSK